jgi:hypothetical protein
MPSQEPKKPLPSSITSALSQKPMSLIDILSLGLMPGQHPTETNAEFLRSEKLKNFNLQMRALTDAARRGLPVVLYRQDDPETFSAKYFVLNEDGEKVAVENEISFDCLNAISTGNIKLFLKDEKTGHVDLEWIDVYVDENDRVVIDDDENGNTRYLDPNIQDILNLPPNVYQKVTIRKKI